MTAIQSNIPSQPATTFLTRDQLARRWNCSISTLKRMESTGELKPVRLGRRLVRFSMAHILGLEQTGATATPAASSTTTN